MKKNEAATQYALAYLLVFTSLYVYFYFDLRGFRIVLLLLAAMNLPSLIVILLLYYLDSKKSWEIPSWAYIFAAIAIFIPVFFLCKSGTEDPRNLFPIFEEPKSIIIGLCVIAHSIAWICILMIEKLRTVFFTKR